MMDRLMNQVEHAFETLSRLLITMRMSAYVFACYAVLQGVGIVIGGPERFSAIAYDAAMNIPGAPETWGVIIGIAGALSFFGVKTRHYKFAGVGMAVAAIWSFAFAMAFAISAVRSPEANLTAIVVYGKDAVLFTLMASANRDMWQQQQKEELSHDDES